MYIFLIFFFPLFAIFSFLFSAMVKVAVLGAGIAGLSSAINVQRQMPEAEVTVIADKFGSGTTSAGAGGFFRPYMPDIYHDGLDPKVAE